MRINEALLFSGELFGSGVLGVLGVWGEIWEEKEGRLRVICEPVL